MAHLVHLAGAVRHQREPGPGGAEPDGGRGGGRPPTGPAATGWPATCSSARTGRTGQPAGRDPARGTGGGAWWWSPRPGGSAEERAARGAGWPWPAWPSSARGCGCAPTTSTCGPTRPTTPTSPSYRRRARRRPGGAGGRPLGPRRLGRAGRAAARRRLGGSAHRRVPTTWPPGSSCRPPCSATCRPTRSCPPELLPADWPGPALRHAYDRWDRRYRAVLRTWGRADPGVLGSPLGTGPD